ncbi:MAG: peptidoglycan editing factor PgeF, partial [Minisyncoccales bacterium]
PLNRIIFPRQTHSSKIKEITLENFFYFKKKPPFCDGLITREKEIFLSIFVSDCLPVLLFDFQKEILGLFHSGWQGTLKTIVKKGLRLFKKMGSKKKNILAFLGPAIGVCCYDIPVKRKKIFQSRFSFWKKFIKEKNKKIFLDLKKLNEILLLKEGLKKSNIFKTKDCTFCQKNFFSWRRKDDYLGNMMVVAGMVVAELKKC